jgi:uncharacterized cupin superfamily protein
VNHVHIPDLPWEEQHSPAKKFHSFCRNISLALGGIRHTGTWGGGHPFDLQIRRIPPGAAVCPFHSHLAQWELFVVRAGSGTVRAGSETHAVKTGDVFIHPPGEPHQLINSGTTDLEVLIVADNPPLDGCFYPDSNKWALHPPGKIFRITETDYFDGEDALPPVGDSSFKFPPAPPPASLLPFAQRKVRIDDVPWETWESPRKKFRGAGRQLSVAVGAKTNASTSLGGHPFDLELGRVAPSESPCVFHSHAAQWECYLFLSGTGTVRTVDGLQLVAAGDVVLHPPGDAHQFTNTGTEDLLYLLVADNPPVDYWHYPDSGKWGLRAPRMFFRPVALDYWDGEE